MGEGTGADGLLGGGSGAAAGHDQRQLRTLDELADQTGLGRGAKMNARITLRKWVSPWRVVSWEVWVGKDFVGRHRLRKDAVRAAEARIKTEEERIERLAREIQGEFF
jgi:hypothetical protein